MNWMNNETLSGFGLRLIWRIMKISEGVRYSGASSFTWYSIMFLSLILIGGLTDRDCFIFRCGPIQDGRHLKPSQDTSRRLVAWMFHQVCSSSIYVSERLWTRLSRKVLQRTHFRTFNLIFLAGGIVIRDDLNIGAQNRSVNLNPLQGYFLLFVALPV